MDSFGLNFQFLFSKNVCVMKACSMQEFVENYLIKCNQPSDSQPAFTCWKLTMETLAISISDVLTGFSLLLWNQSEQKPCPTFSNIIIWVCHYIQLLVQPNLCKWSLKNGHFGQVAFFMKRLAFPSWNLLQLMGF